MYSLTDISPGQNPLLHRRGVRELFLRPELLCRHHDAALLATAGHAVLERDKVVRSVGLKTTTIKSDFTFFLFSSSHLQVLIPLPDPLRFPQQDLSLLHQRQRDCEIALLVYQLDFFHLEENKSRLRGWSGGSVVISYGFLPATLFI